MIKLSLVLINFIGLFVLGIFSDVVIMVNHQTPQTMAPGEKQLVTVTIDKGDVTGFAKLELSLPFGFTATPVETNGSSFTFSGQKAKFIWMTLPSDGKFDITYNLELAQGLTGTHTVTGVFSYINDNQRVDFAIDPKTVTIGQAAPAPAIANNAAQSADASAIAATVNDVSGTGGMSAAEAALTELTCLRTIQKMSDTEFVITLRMINNNIKGFAKIMEQTPENCKPEKVADGGAVVTSEKNSIKFVWFEVPESAAIEVSYKMTCLTPQSSPAITGKLSFVENNAPKELPVISAGTIEDPLVQQPLPDSKTEVTPDPIAEVITEEPKAEPVKTEPKTATVKTEPKAEVKPEPKKTTPPVKEITSVPSPETGIAYKVQIMAAHKVVDKKYFRAAHKYEESFNIENHEGWVKYTTGQFQEYKSARDRRESLKTSYSTLPGPFVTAYNNGERITVQEALLITKQQWFQ